MSTRTIGQALNVLGPTKIFGNHQVEGVDSLLAFNADVSIPTDIGAGGGALRIGQFLGAGSVEISVFYTIAQGRSVVNYLSTVRVFAQMDGDGNVTATFVGFNSSSGPSIVVEVDLDGHLYVWIDTASGSGVSGFTQSSIALSVIGDVQGRLFSVDPALPIAVPSGDSYANFSNVLFGLTIGQNERAFYSDGVTLSAPNLGASAATIASSLTCAGSISGATFYQGGAHFDTGITTLSAISASQNNLSGVVATTRVLRVSATTTGLSITGIADLSNGRRVTIINTGSKAITLTHDSGSSLGANRFYCPGNTNFSLRAGAGIELWYDGTSSRIRVLGI